VVLSFPLERLIPTPITPSVYVVTQTHKIEFIGVGRKIDAKKNG